MAHRLYTPESFQAEKGVVRLYAQLTFAAGGAPTLVTANSKGFCSVVKSATGKYVLTLGRVHPTTGLPIVDTYVRLCHSTVFMDATGNAGTAPAAPVAYVTGNAVATAGTVTVQTITAAGTATNPAANEKCFIELELSNSTAP